MSAWLTKSVPALIVVGPENVFAPVKLNPLDSDEQLIDTADASVPELLMAPASVIREFAAEFAIEL